MATAIIMPRQGQSVESCVITSWSKKVGDEVKVGDILFSYETDKSSFDEEATVEGTLLAIFREEGEDVPCLENVCVIGKEGEDFSQFAPKEEAAPAEVATAPAAAPAVEAPATPAAPAASTAEAGGEKISPRARMLADKTDVDLSKVVPTGPEGRIIERDVQLALDNGLLKGAAPAAEAQAAAPAAVVDAGEFEEVKLSNVRKVIAKSMHASLSNSAQLTLNASFDATKIMAFRASLKAGAEALGLANITLNDIVLYAVAKTLPAHKDLNAHYLDDKMRFFKHVNLGIAVDTERGLLVPTLPLADTLTLNQLANQSKALITEAQGGKISPDKLSGASFTVTNLGSLGIESFTPVINPPQTGILGVCTIVNRTKKTANG
ncbi:MAG: 2-oxo acid dehydrogenase subunit E2, partial [Clostridia bacterium]|nr:2-oxo acid dehydrogenase subunit E2 [Clostridia bacterium]